MIMNTENERLFDVSYKLEWKISVEKVLGDDGKDEHLVIEEILFNGEVQKVITEKHKASDIVSHHRLVSRRF